MFVPKGVATIPAGGGVAANPATDRMHPLFTNMTTQPTPSTFADGFITLSNIGVISPAFANGALSPASATPYMPNLSVGYSVGAGLVVAGYKDLARQPSFTLLLDELVNLHLHGRAQAPECLVPSLNIFLVPGSLELLGAGLAVRV